MAIPVVFPDAEDVARRHLAERLPGAAVHASATPQDLPDLSVTVVRVGGARRDVWDDARLSIDCRAASTPGAAIRLAEQVRAVLAEAGETGWMADIPCPNVSEDAGPYLNPDPLNPAWHRATVMVTAVLRGKPRTVIEQE